jgi:hypothetical protein
MVSVSDHYLVTEVLISLIPDKVGISYVHFLIYSFLASLASEKVGINK